MLRQFLSLQRFPATPSPSFTLVRKATTFIGRGRDATAPARLEHRLSAPEKCFFIPRRVGLRNSPSLSTSTSEPNCLVGADCESPLGTTRNPSGLPRVPNCCDASWGQRGRGMSCLDCPWPEKGSKQPAVRGASAVRGLLSCRPLQQGLTTLRRGYLGLCGCRFLEV